MAQAPASQIGLAGQSDPRCDHLPRDGHEGSGELDQSGNPSDTDYSQVACPACTRFHLVNRKTGKLLGAKA
jgi:hypothetical protein